MDIVFAEEDLSSLITKSILVTIADKGIIVTDEDEADSFILDYAPATLVSYVAAPSEPVVGSYCYKMLIDSETHTLYYFKKHRITKKAGAGFLPEDLERITAHRR